MAVGVRRRRRIVVMTRANHVSSFMHKGVIARQASWIHYKIRLRIAGSDAGRLSA